MRVEVPPFKRCCFCIPLRRGLIGWGYIRVGLNILNAVYLITIISFLYRFLYFGDMAYLLVIVTFVFIDIAFSVLLIVAGHMKSAKLLRVVYIYNIVWLCLVVAFFSFTVGLEVYHMITYYRHLNITLVSGLAVEFVVIVMQGYLILLTRSEMIKLQNQTLEMQFVNHAADGEARCVRADDPASATVAED